MSNAIAILRHCYHTRQIQDWLIEHGHREQVIDWLVWNDGNGVYTDDDSEAEGYQPLTLGGARATMREIVKRSRYEAMATWSWP